MGCDYYFTNLSSRKRSDISYRNVFRYWERNEEQSDLGKEQSDLGKEQSDLGKDQSKDQNEEQFKDIFKEVIAKENWDVNDTIICKCCCLKIYYNNGYIYDYFRDLGESNANIDYFINLSNINSELEKLEKQKQYKETCGLCQKKVEKLYVTKSGSLVCARC